MCLKSTPIQHFFLSPISAPGQQQASAAAGRRPPRPLEGGGAVEGGEGPAEGAQCQGDPHAQHVPTEAPPAPLLSSNQGKKVSCPFLGCIFYLKNVLQTF